MAAASFVPFSRAERQMMECNVKVEVFNVEHGACALITCDDGQIVMIDCGHNANNGWQPGDCLKSRGASYLRALFVTNYDEDHVSGFTNLLANARVGAIFRNMTVSSAVIRQLKSKDGMGPGIAHLCRVTTAWAANGRIGSSDLGLPSNVEINTFCNRLGEFDDENNLSMAVEIICNRTSFLFTGDLETAGWRKLLEQSAFCAALRRTEILFASHHGRQSGCCDEAFQHCSPRFVVISDKAKGFQTQETHGYYHARARGGRVHGQSDMRYVLTTRSDGNMRFDIEQDGSYFVTTMAQSNVRAA
jgi:beta-lactamase superfamily II metal-dependent hydrolase